MSLTSPTLTELQSCRTALNMMYVNGLMSKSAWSRAMTNVDAAIDEKIGNR